MTSAAQLTAFITALLYAGLAVVLAQRLRARAAVSHRWILLALIPALLHAYVLHLAIDTPMGQNLSLLHMASMVSWIIVLLLTIPSGSLALPLAIVALPVAAVTTALLPFVPTEHVLQLKHQWHSLLHIFSALLAYSLLLVAAVQAILLMILEQRLRRAPREISPFMPALTLQETFLFRVISTGFGLLTLSLLIAVFGMPDMMSTQPLNKTVFSFLSWLTFAALLFGRIRYGWRGRIAVRWTLVGFGLLALGYAGTRFVMEYLAHYLPQ